MNDKEFAIADAIRKANGMSEEDRIDLLLMELDREYEDSLELSMQNFSKRAIYLCVAFCGLVLFVSAGHYYGLYTIL